MQPNYGMQPAQPQYSNNPQYGTQPTQPQYGMQPPPNQGYGAAPPQQQGYNVSHSNNPYQQPNNTPPQQNNPYAQPTQPANNNPYANPPETQTGAAPETGDDDAGKEIYENDGADPWKFTPKWDAADDLQLKTACCCCNCAFDDCSDWAQIQCQTVCLCLDSAISWKLFQCQDQAQRACCLNTSKFAFCDFTDPDEDVFCSLYMCGINGIFCLCCSGQAYESICDPCAMPETCAKQLCQAFCIHLRVALPCDEEVPFEIGCCGFMCKEA